MSKVPVTKEQQSIAVLTAMEHKRDSVASALLEQKTDLMSSAGETVKAWSEEKQRDFTNQFAYQVCSDQNLDSVFETAEGKRSIVAAFRRSLETGLQVGGKHAYLIPQGKTVNNSKVYLARFSIKASGYIALFCGGSNPIFKDIKWSKVCDNDSFSVDAAKGEVNHTYGLNRGKYAGYWVQIIKMSGEKQVFVYSIDDINKWKAQARDKTVWNKWPESMGEQACIRHAVSRYEDAKELLGEAIDSDMNEDYTQPDNIADRLNDIMPDIEETPDTETIPQEDIVDEEEDKDTGDNIVGDLF